MKWAQTTWGGNEMGPDCGEAGGEGGKISPQDEEHCWDEIRRLIPTPLTVPAFLQV